MAHDSNIISKIKAPDGVTYELHDAQAIHDIEDLGLASVMQFKGTDTDANIQAKTGASAGDVWLATDTDKEYVYTGTKWEPLGNVHDAASSDHTHTVTVEGTNKASAVTGKVTIPTVSTNAVSIPNVTENKTVTASKISANTSVTASKLDVATVLASATVSDGILSFATADVEDVTASKVTASDVTATNTTLGTAIAASKVTVESADVDIEATAAAQAWSATVTVSEPVSE